MSDGGDGFGEILGRLLQAELRTTRSIDATHRPHQVRWWFEPRTRTAIIESARIIGLAMLPARKHHPFNLDTFGLGALLKAAARKGTRHCFVGLGGSATNDGGFGVARALGWRFFDGQNDPITQWTGLSRLALITPPARSPLGRMRITVATDVRNPLLGRHGASRIYGPQKGLLPTDFSSSERCLGRLAAVVKKQWKKDLAAVPGAGAAGGLAFGLFAFTNARAESGTDLFSRWSKLEQRMRITDLVITGEGSIDGSTLMGKGVGDVARLCRQSGIPCLGLAGVLKDERRVRRRFTDVHSMTPWLTTRGQAGSRPRYWLARLARQVGERWLA
jgi:glycerate kinase